MKRKLQENHVIGLLKPNQEKGVTKVTEKGDHLLERTHLRQEEIRVQEDLNLPRNRIIQKQNINRTAAIRQGNVICAGIRTPAIAH